VIGLLSVPQGGPGLLASAVAGALGVDRASATAAAATRWSVVFSPLLEYVALLTGAGRSVVGPLCWKQPGMAQQHLAQAASASYMQQLIDANTYQFGCCRLEGFSTSRHTEALGIAAVQGALLACMLSAVGQGRRQLLLPGMDTCRGACTQRAQDTVHKSPSSGQQAGLGTAVLAQCCNTCLSLSAGFAAVYTCCHSQKAAWWTQRAALQGVPWHTAAAVPGNRQQSALACCGPSTSP